MTSRLRRFFAATLSGALVWLSLGLEAQEAFAQVIRAPVLPVGAFPAAPAAGAAGLNAPASLEHGLSLPALPALDAPSQTAPLGGAERLEAVDEREDGARPASGRYREVPAAADPLSKAAAAPVSGPGAAADAGRSLFDGGAAKPASDAFLPDESARGKAVLMIGTKSSRPFILAEAVRVSKALGIKLYLVDTPENRVHSKGVVPDSHFIAAPLDERDPKAVEATAELVAKHPGAKKAYAVAGFLSSYAKVAAKITDRLGAAGIPGSAVAASDDKAMARGVLNRDPMLAVPFAVLTSPEQAREAYRKLGGGKFIMKSIRGENSRFLAVNLDSPEAVEKAYREMDQGLKDYAARPESKSTTFSSHPGIMIERMLDKAPGSDETSVEVVMQKGRPAFAMVSDTLNIGSKRELAAGSMTFPSSQPGRVHEAIVEAASRALSVIGINDGNARVDMIVTKDGPKVVEVNPFMGGAGIFLAVRSLTGMSLVEQGLRALLGLKVDSGRVPDGVIDYRFMAAERTGTVERIAGFDAMKGSEGVEHARLFVGEGDTVVAPGKSSYEEYGEIMVKGANFGDALAKSGAALRKLSLRVKGADGQVAETAGDYAQPIAPASGPRLFSKLVFGFLSTFVLVQTVVESTSLAVSQLTEPLSQGFLALTALASTSYLAYAAGSFLGGHWVDRFGVGRSYRLALAGRTLVWTAIAGLFFRFGNVPLMALVPLFSLDYFIHSVGRVAEHKLQVAWFHGSPVDSSRFGSFRDFIEYATVFAASAMGLAVAAYGFGAVLYPAPFAFAAAAGIAAFLGLPGAPKEKSEKIQWSAGFKAVVSNKEILKPLAGYMLVNSFLYMLYYVVATAFGAYVAGGSATHAAAISGSLTGLYGIGALLGALAMDRKAQAMEKATEHLAEPQKTEARRALYDKSAAKALRWAAPALLGSWLFISRSALFTFAWPFFAVSPALIAIGFTGQMALIHLDTIMKDRIPQSDAKLAGGILGAIRALTYLSHVGGFILWGGAFALLGTGAFAAFGLFYTAAAAAYLKLAGSISRSKK